MNDARLDDHNETLRAALKMALSGAVSGGVLGAAGRFLTGAETLGQVARGGGTGAIMGAATAGLSNLLGSALMGPPEEGEQGAAYTKRGVLGGGLIGGGLGGLLGGLGAAGKLRIAANSPAVWKKIAQLAQKELPLNNLIAKKIAEWGSGPTTRAAVLKGAGLGGTALALPSAFMGADEGMMYDAIDDEIAGEQRKKLRGNIHARNH